MSVGIDAHSVTPLSSCRFYNTRNILYTSHVYFFSYGSKHFRPLELQGVTSVSVVVSVAALVTL